MAYITNHVHVDCELVVFILPFSFAHLLFREFEFLYSLAMVFALGISLMLLVAILPSITVVVPEVQGVVTTNLLTGKLVIYGSGLHPRFPWESLHREDHISLRDMTVTIPPASMDSADAEMEVTIQYRFKPELKRLDTFKNNQEPRQSANNSQECSWNSIRPVSVLPGKLPGKDNKYWVGMGVPFLDCPGKAGFWTKNNGRC